MVARGVSWVGGHPRLGDGARRPATIRRIVRLQPGGRAGGVARRHR
jgi:hypothetical protein